VFSIQRADVTQRISHVRLLLNFIIQNESVQVPPLDSDEVKILRGLFYVHLYGAFEKSINEAVEQYRLAINILGVKRVDIDVLFYPVALDPWMTSMRTSSKMKKRIDLIKAALDSEQCVVTTSVFSDLLQNVWSHTLVEVSESIGADADFIRQRRDELYLDEVVDTRNQVAHGRVSAITVGSRGRATDLTMRFDAVFRVLEAFIQMLETHATSLRFIKKASRHLYSYPR
jgi:hypothetical protein